MQQLCATLLAWVALAAPAWAADATLEGYGGDGALLVGLDSKDSPFGNRSGGGGSAGGDGNLVAERAPAQAGAPATGTPQGEPAPAPSAGQDAAGSGASGGGEAPQRGGPAEPRGSERGERAESGGAGDRPLEGAAPAVDERAPVVEGEPAGAGATLPFTGLELALLLAAALSVIAVGAGMRRLALRQAQQF